MHTSFLNILNQLKEPLMQSKLLRKFRKYKLSVDEMIYNEARNNVQALIKDKKRKLLQEKLSENVEKPKELWKTINNWVYQTKRLPQQAYASIQKKSWRFHLGRSQILLKNILRILQVILLRSFLILLENLEYLQCASITRELTSVKKLKFEKVSSVSILQILQEFKTNKATEVDNLVGRFHKDGSNILCTPIAKICNFSNNLASFPYKCKVANIKPLYKKGLKTDPKNFRAISLVPLIFMVIEQIIHDQTMNCLSDNNVLPIQISIKFEKISLIRHLFVIPQWQNRKRFRFQSPDRNCSFSFTEGVRYNWPQHFN